MFSGLRKRQRVEVLYWGSFVACLFSFWAVGEVPQNKYGLYDPTLLQFLGVVLCGASGAIWLIMTCAAIINWVGSGDVHKF